MDVLCCCNCAFFPFCSLEMICKVPGLNKINWRYHLKNVLRKELGIILVLETVPGIAMNWFLFFIKPVYHCISVIYLMLKLYAVLALENIKWSWHIQNFCQFFLFKEVFAQLSHDAVLFVFNESWITCMRYMIGL